MSHPTWVPGSKLRTAARAGHALNLRHFSSPLPLGICTRAQVEFWGTMIGHSLCPDEAESPMGRETQEEITLVQMDRGSPPSPQEGVWSKWE